MMRHLLRWVAGHFPAREIRDRDGKSLYLTRYYVLGGPRSFETAFTPEGDLRPDAVWSKLPVNVYLHRFHRSDDDDALHNHPWKWSLSLILAGGYSEERRYGRIVHRRLKLPGRLNLIRANDFHRVDLIEDDCWTLFIAGPKTQSWAFWDRATGALTHWRAWIDRRRKEATS